MSSQDLPSDTNNEKTTSAVIEHPSEEITTNGPSATTLLNSSINNETAVDILERNKKTLDTVEATTVTSSTNNMGTMDMMSNIKTGPLDTLSTASVNAPKITDTGPSDEHDNAKLNSSNIVDTAQIHSVNKSSQRKATTKTERRERKIGLRNF